MRRVSAALTAAIVAGAMNGCGGQSADERIGAACKEYMTVRGDVESTPPLVGESRADGVARVIRARERLTEQLKLAEEGSDRPVAKLLDLLRPATQALRRSVEVERTSEDARDGFAAIVEAAEPLVAEESRAADLGFPGCRGYLPNGVVVLPP